ncbi:lysosomal membrane ascorbate-dependent ferrireductase CYB561A3 isoform X3 [Betta splendens]|uniref:Lysosomal membrane ascorbate-dependent ferrireductase CYB561A3 n=1 Tax=Betta splendens TaxID=158456 RepID=A0A6P7L4H6_BETSP|nr:lysosomal membrane ascorbate-dependent ferrireductase CYB561A3 isoform X3 [Betta splendens]
MLRRCNQAIQFALTCDSIKKITQRGKQMQQGGSSYPSCSSTSDCFSLTHLSAAQCGSENLSEPEKSEVRANNTSTELSRMRSLVMFYLSYLLCVCLGLSCVICVYVWNSQWLAAVMYRIPLTWGQNKLPWKLLHAVLMLIALVLSVVGLCAVFDYHNAKNIPNVYSLHSWIGIVATALFAMQWAFGATAFLLPCSPLSLRKLLKPVHVWFGGSVVFLSIAACISGINEKLFFDLKENTTGSQHYRELPPEAVLGNALGVLIVAFGLVVLMILSNHKWQRPDSRTGDLAYAPLLQEENE